MSYDFEAEMECLPCCGRVIEPYRVSPSEPANGSFGGSERIHTRN